MKPADLPRLYSRSLNGLDHRTVDTILGFEWLRRLNGLSHYVEIKVAWMAIQECCACKGGRSGRCGDNHEHA